MYRPSQTPRLAVSSNRITQGNSSGIPSPRERPGAPSTEAEALSPTPPRANRGEASGFNPTSTLGARTTTVARGIEPRAGCAPPNRFSHSSFAVGVFHCRRHEDASSLCYIPKDERRCQTKVKLNRVFFPHRFLQVRSLASGFAR